jgi:CubicO group peptidase (beta-lactamase class C family)
MLVVAGPLAAQAPGPLERRVDSIFAQWNRTDSPGCALGVDRDGAPLLRRAYGMMNLETGTPWTVGTVSESGSTAKQFTAAAVVLLARDGVLSLDDDITRWLPEARGFGRRITIRQLLTHTSGIPDRYLLHELMGRPAETVDHPNAEVLDVVAHLRDLNFDPGEDYLYSNTGFILAATLVERASHQSLQAFTDARIFKPLGMSGARWREDHRTVVPGRASAYAGTPGTGLRNEHPFTRVIGSGGLLLTVDDYLKWENALQRGEGPWGALRDSLERPGRLNDGTELTYGLGVGVGTVRGVPLISHTGATGGYRAAVYRLPRQNVAIALLCNLGSIDPATVANRVMEAVAGDAFAPVAAEPAGIGLDSASLAARVGAYHAARTGELLVLAARGDALVDSTAGGARLIPLAAGRFKYRGRERYLTVSPGAPAGAVTLRVEAPNTRAVEYQAVARPALDARALAAYAGTYRSPELGVRYELAMQADTLKLLRGWEPPVALRPLYRDGFLMGEIGLARFLRDSRNRITGFEIWAGRVRHFRLDRVASTARSVP